MPTQINYAGETYTVFSVGDLVRPIMDTQKLNADITYRVEAVSDATAPFRITYTLIAVDSKYIWAREVTNGHILLQPAMSVVAGNIK